MHMSTKLRLSPSFLSSNKQLLYLHCPGGHCSVSEGSPSTVGSVWPGDKIVHVTELAEGLMGGLIERHLQIFQEEVGFDRRQW
jgi:hypothetical protein